MKKIHMRTAHDKAAKYQQLIPQVKGLTEGESDLVANLSNVAAALKYGMEFLWVGFYFVRPTLYPSPGGRGIASKKELVLGPFQGPVACTRIAYGKGVCGTAWKEKKVIVVDNVENFPGHIACSSESKSEIVLPVFDNRKKVAMVMDIDSERINTFDSTDKFYLSKIVKLVESLLK